MRVLPVAIRPARRDDVPAVVAMLADDRLGRGRERLEDPLPDTYYVRLGFEPSHVGMTLRF